MGILEGDREEFQNLLYTLVAYVIFPFWSGSKVFFNPKELQLTDRIETNRCAVHCENRNKMETLDDFFLFYFYFIFHSNLQK